jgi:hypothetical protein
MIFFVHPSFGTRINPTMWGNLDTSLDSRKKIRIFSLIFFIRRVPFLVGRIFILPSLLASFPWKQNLDMCNVTLLVGKFYSFPYLSLLDALG